MAVYFVHGEIFNTSCNAIGHGINCMGKMGAGIAKSIREFYPGVYDWYKMKFERGELAPGQIYIFYCEEMKITVFNLASQKYYGRKPGVEYASLKNIINCFKKIPLGIERTNDMLVKKGHKPIKGLALPPIGCSLGGLKWQDVKPLYEEYLSDTVPVIVYEKYVPMLTSTDSRYIEKY